MADSATPAEYAVDFETYYDDEYSLKRMLPWLYVYDKRFDAYLVSVYSPDRGLRYAGNPKDFDWSQLDGGRLIMHNAAFDGLIIRRLQEDGVIARFTCTLFDTADMAAYLRAPRNLAQACEVLLGRTVDKAVREKLRGLNRQAIAQSGIGNEALEYVMSDAVNCYDLYAGFHDKWPAVEQELSRLNREAQWAGIPCDARKADEDVRALQNTTHDLELSIPWHDTDKLLSPKAFRMECRKQGVSAPASLSKKNPETLRWFEEHATRFPFAAAMRDYRSASGILNRAKALRDGIWTDGSYHYQMMYCGAMATGRFSAGYKDEDFENSEKMVGKFNLTNMPRKPLFGCDLRGTLCAPEGYKFVLGDFGQIEARLVLWRAGETGFLDMLRNEGNLYQAYAKARGIYAGSDLKKDNFELYQYSKVNVLSCGYQCGWKRYRDMALTDYGFDFAPAVAQEHVAAYRSTFPRVPQYWRRHNDWLRISVNDRDATHVVPLVSGRKLTYFKPHWQSRLRDDEGGEQQESYEIVASTYVGGPEAKLYGGKLTENEIQATARDVLRDAWVASDKSLDPAVCRVLFSVYDELVYLVRDDYVAEAQIEIPRVMTTASPYIAGCPMDVELKTVQRYCK